MPFDRATYLARVARMERAGDTETIELPSGEIATVRRLPPEEWLNRAVMPQALTLAAFKRFSSGQAAASEITDADILRLAALRAEMISACLVEPRIVPDEVACGEGELHYADLGAEDAAAIFDWATRRQEAAPLETFRGNDGVPAARGGGGEVRRAPKRTRGHRG